MKILKLANIIEMWRRWEYYDKVEVADIIKVVEEEVEEKAGGGGARWRRQVEEAGGGWWVCSLKVCVANVIRKFTVRI